LRRKLYNVRSTYIKSWLLSASLLSCSGYPGHSCLILIDDFLDSECPQGAFALFKIKEAT